MGKSSIKPGECSHWLFVETLLSHWSTLNQEHHWKHFLAKRFDTSKCKKFLSAKSSWKCFRLVSFEISRHPIGWPITYCKNETSQEDPVLPKSVGAAASMFGGQLKPAGQRNFGKSIPSNIEQNPRKSVARERSMSRDRVNQNGGGRAMSIERTRTRGESRERPRRAESRRRESRAESKDRTRDRSEDRYETCSNLLPFLTFPLNF